MRGLDQVDRECGLYKNVLEGSQQGMKHPFFFKIQLHQITKMPRKSTAAQNETPADVTVYENIERYFL